MPPPRPRPRPRTPKPPSTDLAGLSTIGAGRACVLLALLSPALLLSACAPNDNDPGPGVTVGEARALDEAAEMLDAQRLPADALPPQGRSSSPSPGPAATD